MGNFNTEQRARDRGMKLLERLHGTGWALRVWENLGWHYAASNGTVNVHPSGNDKFFCLIGSAQHPTAGLGVWTKDGDKSTSDPNEAVRRSLKLARGVVDDLNETLSAAEQAVGV